MSFQTVKKFELLLADFYGAPYAVATDCCTHGIELCLRMTDPSFITVPKHTYISVPFTFEKLNLNWDFRDEEWSNYYYIGNTNIIDGAVHFARDGYIPDTLMCLSFQFKKPLGLGRGGAILCSTQSEYDILKRMVYDGRDQTADGWWGEQSIDTMGYHYYMTPETAQQGIDKLPVVSKVDWPVWDWQKYPDLSTMPVFEQKGMLYYV